MIMDPEQAVPRTLDLELTAHDVQALNSADAVAAFFARLGYNTDKRTEQTPANLGMTAEGAARPIKRIELIADQENLFHIYLFELTSVTVSHTRALARAFRNRAGNYLLVLTSDYERLDFVLLEKYLPAGGEVGSGMGQVQVGVRPRTLTIERRKPSRVHLRVLRRLTWTEADPFAQYEKLLSAYAVADWSEEYFNNRALFSDYYLLERLPGFPAWSEDPKPAYRRLRELYHSAAAKFAGQGEHALRKELLEPTFQALGFEIKPGKKASSSAGEPDYRLCSPTNNAAPIALCLAYPWGRSLDGKDDQRDKETPEENPGAVVVSLLEKGEAPWVVVTNGKLWRLYSQRAHSRATNYYEIDLEEILAQAGPQAADPAEAFRYFWLLFRRQAFEPVEVRREGKELSLPFLDRLLLESEDYAKELGERLKERVFEEIFPHLATGFITHIREVGPAASRSFNFNAGLAARPTILSQETLDTIFQGTLTFLYRLLFLLYAEARDLLPVKEVRGYFEASLTTIKREVAEAAGTIADQVEERLKTHYREDSYQLYEHLSHLFHVVDKGDTALNVPIYNGGLFLSNPDDEDDSPEAQVARFLNATKVPDRFLARALDLLARDIDPKRQDLVFIDYKSLGVRQLGSIYEGLLEFKLRIADRKLAIVKEKGREVYVFFSDLDEREQERAERQRRVVKQGQVYLENDKRERKATGSYYTPDHIVKYIVEHAVGPVLQEKFEAMRPKLREAQKWHRDMIALAQAKREPVSKYEFGPAVEYKWGNLVDELFNLKVLDPAMGSGHFLVEAVDFITDKALDFLSRFPWNPVFAHLAWMRQTILDEMDDQGITIDAKRLTDVNLLKRHILKRCIYGVDVNPMAVELAKVSLWLHCFTLGAPLSFLDHHLRCGNSLIGVTVDEVNQAIQTGQLSLLSGTRFEGMKQAVAGMIRVGELSDVTAAQLRESRREYRRASDAMKPAKRLLDVYTSQWFGNTPRISGRGKKKVEHNRALEFLRDGISEQWAQHFETTVLPEEWKDVVSTALQAVSEKRFFHWELEFPEVFYGPREGLRHTVQIVRLENAGFDVVIGNPPYDVLASEELGYDVSQDQAFYESVSVYEPAIRWKKNLYKLFVCRGATVMSRAGAFSFIVPMALLGDDQAAGVRRLLLEQTGLAAIEAFPQKDDPHNRVFPEAKLSTTIFVTYAKPTRARFTVRTHPGRYIEENSPLLLVAPEEIIRLSVETPAIPSCTQRDWNLVVRILDLCSYRLGRLAKLYQGEINETVERPKRTLSSSPIGPLVLRGAAITLYAIRPASQGEDLDLEVEKFLKDKREESKAFHHQTKRIGLQRKAPQNNFRRLIAAPIPAGRFCFESINYCIEDACHVNLDLLLCLLNSKLLEWFFRTSSTNAQVNEYQFNALPIPALSEDEPNVDWRPLLEKSQWIELADLLCAVCTEPGVMPKPVAEALAEMSRRIQQIEAKRVLKNRSERSRLAAESQPIQDAIDAVLFRCYGLSDDDARYVAERLKEML